MSTDITDLGSAIATTAFTLQITDAPTGAYTFTLLQALEHAPGNWQPTIPKIPNIDLVAGLYGDRRRRRSAPGTIAVTIDDDIPVQTGATEAQTVYEVLLTGGNPDTPANPGGAATIATGTLAGLVTVGADEPATFTLSPDQWGCRALTSKGGALFTTSTASR